MKPRGVAVAGAHLLLVSALVSLFAPPVAAQFVLATIDVGPAPCALAYDSVHNKLFAALEGANQVVVIDPDQNEVTATIPVGAHPSALALSPTSNRLYVGNNVLAAPGTVSIISTADNTVVGTLGVGEGPVAMAWNSTRNKVYVMNRDAATVSVIDCAGSRVTATVRLSQTLNAIVYNPVNDRVYVSSGAYQSPGKVFAVNCGTDALAGTTNCGTNAGAMAVNPLNNRLYVASIGSDSLFVVNCANGNKVGRLRTADEPHAVIWTPDNRVFVTSYWGGKLQIMHGDSTRFYREVALTGNPENLLYSPGSRLLYVARPLQSRVTVIEAPPGGEGHVIADIAVGGGPRALAVYPAEDQVYVANTWDRTVTVIKDVVGVADADPCPIPLGVRLGPNPAVAGARLSLRADGFLPERVEFWNAAGHLVRATGRGELAAPASAGVYFYRVSDGGRSFTGKLAVE